MPSRPVQFAILLFWVGTTGYVAYRDVWPRLVASGPPPMAIDLAEEASQNTAVRWTIYRGETPVGKLVTQMKYLEADDTFRFTHDYRQVQLDFAGLVVSIPEMTTVIRVNRAGDLKEQAVEGKLEVRLGPVPLASGKAKIGGVVTNGQLVGRCEVKSSFGDLVSDLDPVPVPSGQPLNPLQPVNRIANLRPGQRWTVHEIDPLGEAIAALVKAQLGKQGMGLPDRKREPLLAEVLREEQPLRWKDEDVPCRVIEYRRTESVARTWVRASDGKVLRQEAFDKGERLAVERED